MTEAVIVSTARTPIGRGYKGSLIGHDAFDLAEIVVGAAVARSGIAPQEFDDIVVAEALAGGGVIARNIAVRLGILNAAGLANNRACAAGLSAVQIAAASIMAGMDKVVVAGGTESMTNMPLVTKPNAEGQPERWISPSHPETPDAPCLDTPLTVGENTAREMGLTRHDLDEWAAYSQRQAIAAIDNGWFEAQIVPVNVTDREGNAKVFNVDEFPRRGVTVESLGELKVLHPEIPGAVITAGNSSGINDGAAAMVLTSGEFASAHGLTPLGRVLSWASIGLEPARTGMGPTVAIPKALDRAGLSVGDIGLWEINEAFCSVPIAAVRKLGIDPSIVNVYGSGCSLGHPIACTGSRMVVTMLAEMHRRGIERAVVSMCAGGGMGSALVLEAL
jgi:acetyl-CoA acetyltransferase family protein